MTTSAPWLDDAVQFPVYFAQVREDALLDLEVLDPFAADAQVAMIASGGCTAAALAAHRPFGRIHLVDANPAQLALTRLKLRLLQTDPGQRLSLLGHAPMAVEERQRRLGEELAALGLTPDCLGPLPRVAALGPDHCGRYELLFAQLREAFRAQAADLDRVLRLTDPAEQARRVDPARPLGQALDEAFDTVMDLANLVALFGEGATRNRVEPFARHFARRTRHALATLPAATNPYLWQMLGGRFPAGTVYPWLTAPAPARLPEVTYSLSFMADELAKTHAGFDVVHLSNILDWLSVGEAQHTLEVAWNALRPGGVVLIRQLNSSLDIPGLGGPFQWLPEAASLHARDRSFFYRHLHLGRKP